MHITGRYGPCTLAVGTIPSGFFWIKVKYAYSIFCIQRRTKKFLPPIVAVINSQDKMCVNILIVCFAGRFDQKR